jgi:hypothetical protein
MVIRSGINPMSFPKVFRTVHFARKILPGDVTDPSVSTLHSEQRSTCRT